MRILDRIFDMDFEDILFWTMASLVLIFMFSFSLNVIVSEIKDNQSQVASGVLTCSEPEEHDCEHYCFERAVEICGKFKTLSELKDCREHTVLLCMESKYGSKEEIQNEDAKRLITYHR